MRRYVGRIRPEPSISRITQGDTPCASISGGMLPSVDIHLQAGESMFTGIGAA